MCSHLHYSKNLRGFRAYSQNRAKRTINHAWLRTSVGGSLDLFDFNRKRVAMIGGGSFEIHSLEKELKEAQKKIAYLQSILSNEKKMLKVIEVRDGA